MIAVATQRDRIQAVADFIGRQKRLGTSPAELIALLVDFHDARLSLRPWTNGLRIAGVSVTCTWSQDAGLIDAWLRLATRRLLQLDGRSE